MAPAKDRILQQTTCHFGWSIINNVDSFWTWVINFEVLGCLKRKHFCKKMDCDSETIVVIWHRLHLLSQKRTLIAWLDAGNAVAMTWAHMHTPFLWWRNMAGEGWQDEAVNRRGHIPSPSWSPRCLLNLPGTRTYWEPAGSGETWFPLPTPASQSGERRVEFEQPAQLWTPTCSSCIFMNWQNFIALILSSPHPQGFESSNISSLSNLAGAF